MTEHAAVIFVFFFLAEYASIILICILTSVLFLGGYLYDYISLNYFIYFVQFFDFDYYIALISNPNFVNFDSITHDLFNGLALGIKSCIMIFIFIWVRVSFPRIRFDQLMSYC